MVYKNPKRIGHAKEHGKPEKDRSCEKAWYIKTRQGSVMGIYQGKKQTPINRSINRSTNRSINRENEKTSINQSITQIDQSIDQSIEVFGQAYKINAKTRASLNKSQ